MANGAENDEVVPDDSVDNKVLDRQKQAWREEGNSAAGSRA